MTEVKDRSKLVFRGAFHARTREEALHYLDKIDGIFRDDYFTVKIDPRTNRNPNTPLEWFAMIFVYEKDVIQ